MDEQRMDRRDRASEGTIVVGHDGSAGADAALGEALAVAGSMGCGLLVVRAWAIDTAPAGALFTQGSVSPLADVDEVVREALRRDVETLIAGRHGVPVDLRGELGRPGEVLVTEAASARMLVVGSRGRSAIASRLLGSVSEYCVRHAPCPVLVVPSRFRGRDARPGPSAPRAVPITPEPR